MASPPSGMALASLPSWSGSLPRARRGRWSEPHTTGSIRRSRRKAPRVAEITPGPVAQPPTLEEETMGKDRVTLDDLTERLENLAALSDLVFIGIQYHVEEIGTPLRNQF